MNGSSRRLVPEATPAPLVVAAALTVLEALALLAYAVLELAATDSGRLAVGLTTAAFFLAYGLALVGCSWALLRRRSWARSPLVLAQLIQLGVAWSFLGGDTMLIAVLLGLVALAVLVGILHPRSVQALAHDPA